MRTGYRQRATRSIDRDHSFRESSFAFRQRATLSIAQIKKLPSLSFGSFVLRGTRTSLFFFPSFFIVSFFFLSFLLLFLFRAAVIVGKYRGNSVESNEPSGFAERIQRDKIRRRDGVTVIEGKPNKARLIVHPRITRGKDERSSRARIYTHSFTPIDHTLRRAKIRHAKVPLNYSSVSRVCTREIAGCTLRAPLPASGFQCTIAAGLPTISFKGFLIPLDNNIPIACCIHSRQR